ATLRNWDKSGKLKAVRHPLNKYRAYDLHELQKIQARLPLGDNEIATERTNTLDVRATRALIARLHNILRDRDSHSNIIERFDELTKLLFLKLVTEENSLLSNIFFRADNENDHDYASRIREGYAGPAENNQAIIQKNFPD